MGDQEPQHELLIAIGKRLRADRPLAIVDLETTGLLVGHDRIVEISIWKLHIDQEPWIVETWSTLINASVPIPAAATAVHGITDAAVADAQPFKQWAPTIAELLAGCDLIGYSVAFDQRMLVAEFERAGVRQELDGARVIDAYRIFQSKEPRDLSAAVAFYCGAVGDTSHRADADVAATAQVLHAQLECYTDLPVSVAELHAFCLRRDPSWLDEDGKVVWRDGEARLNFGKHAGRSLHDLVADETGYLEWMLEKDFPSDTQAIVRDALTGTFPESPPAQPERS